MNDGIAAPVPLDSSVAAASTDEPGPAWAAPAAPPDPRSWPIRRRWLIVALISLFTFISPMSSSMVAPALHDIARDLHITSGFTRQLVLSIYLLLFGIVPVLFAPLSEQYGRVPILQIGNVIFIAFNTACAFVKSPTQMLVCRALSGLGGGAPLAIGAAVIGDLFVADERGTALAIYNVAPIIGPTLGAILGAAATEYLDWRWLFRIVSLLDGAFFLVSLPVLTETYAPVLLRRHNRQQQDSSDPSQTPTVRSIAEDLWRNLMRPLRMLRNQAIIQILATYVSLLYGLIYLVLSTFPTLWTINYHQSIFRGGLNFIALGLGYVLGTQLCALSIDRIYRRLKRHNGNSGTPEFRLPLAMFSFLLVPIGLIIYGWSAQYQVFWVVPDLGACIFSMGTIIGMQCVSNYLLDAYPQYAASALGAVTLLRGIAGFAIPLFGPALYDRLGYGWGNTLLALVSFFTGLTAPVALWFCGARLRQRHLHRLR